MGIKILMENGKYEVTAAEVGLGGLLFEDDVARAWQGTASNKFIVMLVHRETQIIALELLALCATVNWAKKELAQASAVIFVDNMSVACMVAKGCTRMPDLHPMVTALIVFLKRLGCKWWIEYVPSKANPADEPSRCGKSKFAKCEEASFPRWAVPFMDLRSAIEIAHPKNNKKARINWKSKQKH